MRSTIKSQLLGNRADLELERKGLVSARATERELAALRQPAVPSVTAPAAITTDIHSGAALADLLTRLDDQGVIDNQSRRGTDKIVPLSDAATSLDALTSTGIVVRTGPGSFVTRRIDGYFLDQNGIATLNGDGVKSSIQIALENRLRDIARLDPASVGLLAISGQYATVRTLVAGVGITIPDGAGLMGDPLIALDLSAPTTLRNSKVGTDGVDATTTNNATYASGIDLNWMFPSGTWTAYVDASANFKRGVAGLVDFQLYVAGSAVTASYVAVDAQATYYTTARSFAVVSGITGGSSVHFESRYKNNGGGNTITCKNPFLTVTLVRTA